MRELNSQISRSRVLFQVSVSLFGLVLAVLLAVSPQVSADSFVWRRPLVGSAFATICILGILAVLSPSTCSKPFRISPRKNKQDRRFSHASASALRGHHPQCSHFSGHVFRVDRRVLCATCSGLFSGALFALVGVVVYFFGSWHIGQNAIVAVAVGAVGVALGLMQSPLPVLQTGVMRLFTGALFVAGAFLVLLGIEELTHSFSLGLFVVALSVLWLATKISLSQWDHERICSRCTSDSCDDKIGRLRKES